MGLFRVLQEGKKKQVIKVCVITYLGFYWKAGVNESPEMVLIPSLC